MRTSSRLTVFNELLLMPLRLGFLSRLGIRLGRRVIVRRRCDCTHLRIARRRGGMRRRLGRIGTRRVSVVGVFLEARIRAPSNRRRRQLIGAIHRRVRIGGPCTARVHHRSGNCRRGVCLRRQRFGHSQVSRMPAVELGIRLVTRLSRLNVLRLEAGGSHMMLTFSHSLRG